tara:strand:- start:2272 stop:3342 length:1071 start_codon:yes stop_codon:yes gene_type:complete
MKNMKDLKHYYYSPVDSLIGVKTNIKDFSFSYGMAMPYSDKSIFGKSKIKITLNVVKGRVEPTKEDKDKMGKFHYFNGFPNSGEIFYERNFIYKRKLQFKISGIDTNNIEVTVNKDYMRYVRHRFMNIHSMGYILTDIINLRLMHNNLAPLHCSGVVVNHEGYAIFAPPNTGKTLTAMTLCMNNNSKYKFIAEDLALTDGKKLFAVPWTSTFRYYDTVDTSRFSKFLNNMTEKISILELFSFGKTEPITNYVKDISMKAPIKGIYILDRGEIKNSDISAEEAFDRINTLDRYEFNYMRAPTIIAYEYFNRKTDIEFAYKRERELLKEMISTADFLRVISTDNALNYAKEIEKEMKE